MFIKITQVYWRQIKKNPKPTLLTFSFFIMGVVIGSITFEGLVAMQKQELTHYIQGFMKIFDIEKVDNIEVFRISLFKEMKQVLLIWSLGASIIGIPFIFLIVLFRGFTIGFTYGIIMSALGRSGVFSILSIFLLKDLYLLTVLLSLAVNGVVFSTEMIANLFGKRFVLQNIKGKFLRYTMFASLQLGIVLIAVMLEALFLPVFIKV